MAPSLQNTENRRLLWAALALLGVLGLSLGYRQITSPDLGFHLATARWMVENGAFPSTDPFTYTVSDHRYIDLQWLFQVLMYGLLQLGGTFLIMAATTVLTVAFGALLLLRVWRHEGRIPGSSLVLLLVFALAQHWEPRPHLLSWLWGSLLLLVLEENARGARRWLPALPLAMVGWVNSHSLFVLGLVIIATYAGSNVLLAACKRADLDRRLLLWSAVAGFACLLNPYHVHGLLFPLVQYQDIQGGSIFKAGLAPIAEFSNPLAFGYEYPSGDVERFYYPQGRFVLLQPRLFWQLTAALAVLAAAGLWAARRRVRLPELILAGGFAYIFVQANKNYGYAVLVMFPLISAGLSALATQLRVPRRLPLGATLATTALLLGAVWSGWWYEITWTGNHHGSAFDREHLPVDACEFLLANDIEGRLLNGWDEGGYIAWATRQKVFVYSHGEVMTQAFYQEYVDANQPDGFAAALAKWQPTVAVVPFEHSSYWLYHLMKAPDWRLVYRDLHTAILLHRSVAPQVPALPEPRAGVDFTEYDAEAAKALIQQALAAPPQGLWQWLRGRSAYPTRELTLSSFYLHAGEVSAGYFTSLAGLERTPFAVPDLLLNLGHALNARRLYSLADLCFDRFLELDDNPVLRGTIAKTRRARR